MTYLPHILLAKGLYFYILGSADPVGINNISLPFRSESTHRFVNIMHPYELIYTIYMYCYLI